MSGTAWPRRCEERGLRRETRSRVRGASESAEPREQV